MNLVLTSSRYYLEAQEQSFLKSLLHKNGFFNKNNFVKFYDYWNSTRLTFPYSEKSRVFYAAEGSFRTGAIGYSSKRESTSGAL